MTGKELIIYILVNNLEDENIFKDGKIASLMTINEAALTLGTGINTVQTMVDLEMLASIDIYGKTLIPEREILKHIREAQKENI